MKLTDPAIRWAQYAAALEFWLDRPGLSGIVFAENSGYEAPYETFRRMAAERGRPLEILSWNDNGAGQQRGKGYGEGRLMERAVAESHLLRGAPGFFKVTGRLWVKNFDWLERTSRTHPIAFQRRFLGHAGWVDTRFFKVDRMFFLTHLARAYQDVTEVPVEVERRWALGQAYAAVLEPLAPPSFLPLPLIVGASSLGPRYEEPTAKFAAKNVLALLGRYRLQSGASGDRRCTSPIRARWPRE
jgi:hypothetical protein